MSSEERWVEAPPVRLHYLDSRLEADPTLVPLVYVPGRLGGAEDFSAEMQAFAPRRCLSLSLRGRGKSEAPPTGYGLEDHLQDLAAIIAHATLPPCCLMAFSASVPYAIRYAALHPAQVRGLILLDYPARTQALSDTWVERVLAQAPAWQARARVLEQMQRESADLPLWEDLAQITRPTLILRGGQPGSLLSPEEAQQYQDRLAQARLVVFEQAGHELWAPNYARFLQVIQQFLEQIT